MEERKSAFGHSLINIVPSARWKKAGARERAVLNGFHRPGGKTVETVVRSIRLPPPG
jgi:hypothetical protein